MNTLQRIEQLEAELAKLKAVASSEVWTPAEGEEYYFVSHQGKIECYTNDLLEVDRDIIGFHLAYCTEEKAEKALAMTRVSNAIIQACLHVDPDYEFTPLRNNYTVYYCTDDREWLTAFDMRLVSRVGYVSTKEKAEEVASILNKTGVKPA